MSEPIHPTTDERLMLIPVQPAPEFIEASGRWKWPLKPPHDNDGRCPAVYTASREWWEYAPDAAKPHPWAEATQLRDGKWYWTVPVPKFEAPPDDDPIPQCDTTTARVRKLIEMDAVPSYLVRALLHERDGWRQNYWDRMEQISKEERKL